MSSVTRPGREHARIGLVVVWLLLAGFVPAAAHPHVFVDYSVAILLTGESLDGLRFTWTFDDLFSGFIMQEFDRDRNQMLSPDEVRTIEQKHMPEFQRVSYFTTISVNGKPAAASEARGFRANVAKGIVTYEFVLPVKVPLAGTTTLEVVIDDPVYYIAYTPVAVTPQMQTVGTHVLECRVVHDRTGATPGAVSCGIRRR